MVELLSEHGQGGACSLARPGFTYHNSFIVADPRTAFVLETAGRHHAVEEISGARSISNGLTIPGFAERHSDIIKTRVSACRLRQRRTQALAARADEPGDLMRILRDHGEGRDVPKYSWLNGGLGAPCVHACGLVASSQTTGSWVAELRAGAIRHWATATAAPCTGLFKPVEVERPIRLGPAPTDRADDESLWWRHERLHRAVVRDPARLGRRYFAERDEVEAAWLADPPETSAAFAEADRLLARWTEQVATTSAADKRPWFVRRYWKKLNAQAGLQFGPLAQAAL